MKTNYEMYFGSHIAVARRILDMCMMMGSCIHCPAYDEENDCPIGGDYDCALKWLESEVNNAD